MLAFQASLRSQLEKDYKLKEISTDVREHASDHFDLYMTVSKSKKALLNEISEYLFDKKTSSDITEVVMQMLANVYFVSVVAINNTSEIIKCTNPSIGYG